MRTSYADFGRGDGGRDGMVDADADAIMATAPTIMLVANTGEYLVQCRAALLTALRAHYRLIVVTPDPSPHPALAQFGVDHKTLMFSPRRRSLMSAARGVLHMFVLLLRYRPQRVATFNPMSGVVVAVANSLRLTRQITTITGFGLLKPDLQTPPRGKRRLLHELIMHYLIRHPAVVVAENHEDYTLIVQRRGPHRRTERVMSAGVDLEHYSPAKRDYRTRRLLYAARFMVAKGLMDYLAVARMLADDQCRFAVSGMAVTGENGLSVAAVQAAIGTADIEFLGQVTDMATELARTDIVVLPSVYGEGIPRILLEAAAAGCVLVAYDNDGVREIVLDGITGRLVTPPTVTALRAALQDLCTAEPRVLHQLSAQARAQARHFGADGVTACYYRLLTQ